VTSEVAAKRRTVFGAVTSSASLGILSLLAGLLMLPLIFSRVGVSEYGVWIILTTMTTYLYQSDLGMGSAVIRYASVARSRNDREGLSKVSCSSLMWMTIVGVVVAPIAGLCFYFGLGSVSSDAGIGLEVFVAVCVFSSVTISLLGLRCFSALMQGLGFWSLEKKFQMVGLLIRVVGTVTVCLFYPHILVLALVETLALIVPVFLSSFYVLHMNVFDFGREFISFAQIKHLLSYSLRVFAVGAVGTAIIQAGVIIAGVIVSPAVAAYYSAVLRLYLAVRQAITWVVEPFVPALARLHSLCQDRDRKFSLAVISVSTLVGGIGSLALLVSSKDILRLWLGEGVPIATLDVCLMLMMAGMFVNSLHIGSISALNAMERPGAYFTLQLVWLVSTVALCVVLGKQLGIVGISLGNMLPIVFLEFFYVRKFLRLLNIKFRKWFLVCLMPLILLCSVGLAVGALFSLISLALTDDLPRMAAGFGFAFGVGAMLFISRRSVWIRSVRDSLSLTV
jgi:O-antigen/teichoic acid export membrane protein